MHQLILASHSPRRKKLLEDAGFQFHTFSVKVSENIKNNLRDESAIESEILRLAKTKAEAACKSFSCQSFTQGERLIFLGADTLVILRGQIFGKPENKEQAKVFLRQLSGQIHQVKTAVFLLESEVKSQIETGPGIGYCEPTGQTKGQVTTTEVQFRVLSDHEISDYVNSGEPMDKAGAYGIQGSAGKFVERIHGPFDNVVGLPITTVQRLLEEEQWKV